MITAHERLLVIDNLNFAKAFDVCNRPVWEEALAWLPELCQRSFCEDLKNSTTVFKTTQSQTDQIVNVYI